MAIGTHQYSHCTALACRPAGYRDSEEVEGGACVLLRCPGLGMALQSFITVRARRGERKEGSESGIGKWNGEQ